MFLIIQKIIQKIQKTPVRVLAAVTGTSHGAGVFLLSDYTGNDIFVILKRSTFIYFLYISDYAFIFLLLSLYACTYTVPLLLM